MTTFAQHTPGEKTMKPVLTIAEFCQETGISRTFLYELKKKGKGPRYMRVGRRCLITAEALEDWKRDYEDATALESGVAKFEKNIPVGTVELTSEPACDIRDRFAGQAMMGLLASGWCHESRATSPIIGGWEDVADDAYRMADAMLKARSA